LLLIVPLLVSTSSVWLLSNSFLSYEPSAIIMLPCCRDWCRRGAEESYYVASSKKVQLSLSITMRVLWRHYSLGFWPWLSKRWPSRFGTWCGVEPSWRSDYRPGVVCAPPWGAFSALLPTADPQSTLSKWSRAESDPSTESAVPHSPKISPLKGVVFDDVDIKIASSVVGRSSLDLPTDMSNPAASVLLSCVLAGSGGSGGRLGRSGGGEFWEELMVAVGTVGGCDVVAWCAKNGL
jgi:hypothetical protein